MKCVRNQNLSAKFEKMTETFQCKKWRSCDYISNVAWSCLGVGPAEVYEMVLHYEVPYFF